MECADPAGEVHAWTPRHQSDLCGLALSRSRVSRHPRVDWDDTRPKSGRHADEVRRVRPRCAAGADPWRRGRRTRRGG